MHGAVEVSLDMELTFKGQGAAEVVKVVAAVRWTSYHVTVLPNDSSTFSQIKVDYPFIEKYHNAWPVNMLVRPFLGDHRNNLRAKMKVHEFTPTDTTAEPSTAAPGPDLENQNQDGDESDVVVSGIGDE